MKKFLAIVILMGTLGSAAWCNPIRFGRSDSPARFRVDIPGSWLRGKVEGCFEDVLGSRVQAIIAENADRTVANTYPDWKKRFSAQGYEVREVNLNGAPGLLAKSSDSAMGIVLHKGHQVNLMINVSNPEVNLDELLTQLAQTFQWLNP